jgi:uncharacterized protein YoxC
MLEKMEDVHQKLTELLTHFDSMAVEVKGITTEVHGLHQQMQDFGEDLDGVKRRMAGTDKGVA